MLLVKDVVKIYPKSKKALEGLTFAVEKGECLVIYGENGAGKTTLLKIIAGFLIPDSGGVFLDGMEISADLKLARRHVSISTGQERSFYYRLTVKENLRFFAVLNGLFGRKLREKTEVVMKLLGLDEYRDVPYMKLSKGYKKRLDIARALLKDARVYVFDEPCSGVDLKTRKVIHDIVGRLKAQSKIVILASHELEDIEIADKVVILKDGKKIAELKAKTCSREMVEGLL